MPSHRAGYFSILLSLYLSLSLSICRPPCGCPFRLLPRCVAGRPVIVTVCFRKGFVILCCQVEHAH